MFFVSASRAVSSPFNLSEPAKSTKFKFPTEISPFTRCVPISLILATECDLDDLENNIMS